MSVIYQVLSPCQAAKFTAPTLGFNLPRWYSRTIIFLMVPNDACCTGEHQKLGRIPRMFLKKTHPTTVLLLLTTLYKRPSPFALPMGVDQLLIKHNPSFIINQPLSLTIVNQQHHQDPMIEKTTAIFIVHHHSPSRIMTLHQ